MSDAEIVAQALNEIISDPWVDDATRKAIKRVVKRIRELKIQEGKDVKENTQE